MAHPEVTMPNRLAQESSPYLLQHQDNPVDWYPWGTEALEHAKQSNRPIFLSIGYSACHWCHVMEHESFESEEIARGLNTNFVCIKVDREERPDLDQIYMNAVQMLTGRGGWPMSVFLTPDLKPFYGGTYWPPESRHGMPGFDQIIEAVARAWNDNHDAVIETSNQLTAELARITNQSSGAGELTESLVTNTASHLSQTYDRTYGGFGSAPKFPAPMSLRLLMRHWQRRRDSFALEMVTGTLDRMAAGGIYDHLGGGFARYSVDARWLVPHFEKMLYDNAQLALAYLEAYQITGNGDYARVVGETLDYVLRDMTDSEGGFYSTEDADSEGVEGKFYTWTPAQLAEVLGDTAAATFAKVYDVSEVGNFEETNILNLPRSLEQQAKILGRDKIDLGRELAESRKKLFEARENRVHPHKDDKVIVAWNALMIEALAAAGAALSEPRYTEAACRAADFIREKLRKPDGRLLHTWRNGVAKVDAYLDDYSYLACALIALYEATGTANYFDWAVELVEVVLSRFGDQGQGGFYYTSDDQEQLLVRNKEFADNAVPSGNAMAALALVKLAKLTGDEKYRSAAESTMQACVELMQRFPAGTAQMLLVVDLSQGPTFELVFAGDDTAESREALAELQRRFLPHKVMAYAGGKTPEALASLLAGKLMIGGHSTLYICEGFTCQEPAQGEEAITRALDTLAPPHTVPSDQ
jgi:uncharacterized protein YyaL (SSP411 family)